jgi:hypothetical protein
MRRKDARTIVPRARKKALLVRHLADESLVYDLLRLKAHCLNRTAASIWKHCDGRRTASEIAARAGKEIGATVSTEAVWLAVSQLGKIHLLDGRVQKLDGVAPVSRRDLVRLGVSAALAVPVIFTMAAPTPAQVVSCRANGSTGCTSNAQCCGGCCGGRSGVGTTGTCSNTSNAAGSRGTGAGCSVGGQCCSGVCTAGACTA